MRLSNRDRIAFRSCASNDTKMKKLIQSALCIFAVTIAVPMHAQQVHVPASVLQRYEGEWVYPDGSSVTVRLRGETLYREIQNQQVPLVPMSETLFRLGPVFTAEFILDQKGGATQILTDGTIEFRLIRKGTPPAEMPPAPPSVPVSRSVLQRYVGTYEYIPGQLGRTDLRIEIRLNGDTLMRVMGSDAKALIPVSETRFRVANTSQMTEFVVDDAGVTQINGSGFQQLLTRLTSKH